ncbi:hypothetical protein BGZ47_004900 [Haplosporangium gracile]|nr:hypothetical protein BGZ47_004900 [Haplosporangium gracile]
MTVEHQQQQHHQHHTSNENDTVLIVGAGIAGMMLALLLQKAGIPYDIYERAAEIKALGSALYFNATTARIFKQVGIYEELYALGKNTTCIQIASEQSIEYKMDFKDQQELFGSTGYIISRPMLYDVLRRQVPRERFHMGRKVISISQSDDVDKDSNPGKGGVTIEFQDRSTVRGGILVGADGAYSVVRQNLYSQLKEKNLLPASDDVPLPFNVVCLVGQTKPLDPETYPYLKLEDCQFIRTLGDNKPYTHGSFKNSEWGPEAVETMTEKVRSFPIISGSDKKLTLGDLINWTPKELISKVMLEEKVFKTWHHGRAVLIGDACHKLSPAGGSGANCAIHDAVALANRIYALPENRTIADIDQAFKAYRDERMPWVEAAFNSSTMMKSMVEQIMIKMQYYQPQAAFLPLIENQGTVEPAFQEGLHDILPIVEARRKSKHAAKHTSDADAGTATSTASTTLAANAHAM